ncbi:2-carboxy-D-arabinitol-1-phosphatase [Marininema halotolerans]|uniref:Broad specificity phosphatase PhoE n=1 Tax=Marininema halotolerans TaxID=1155944 RepID=A0A1I6PU88_9BACL|nr:histidine phosphatase family protein [Marininema halotolerans]SFS43773.1 Broad specificity phosphatase PhoE [Marininema halotolerans]
METHVYLIRHGETKWNQEKRLQGHLNMPLSSVGKEQAQRLGKRFLGKRLQGVYASDLDRAIETAVPIAEGSSLFVQTFNDLRERKMGEWEGKLISEIKENYPDAWERVWQHGDEFGVEGTASTQQRMLHRLEALAKKHPGEAIAVVSHGGGINTVLHAISEGAHGPGLTKIDNTSVTHLIYDTYTGWKIHRIGCTHHLVHEDFKFPVTKEVTLFLVRHCQATDQAAEATLTAQGREQAKKLGAFLASFNPKAILASPWRRTMDTATPLAQRLGLPIQTDERLTERVLAAELRGDWLDRLRESYEDFNCRLPGGESNQEAMNRGVAALTDFLEQGWDRAVIVGHGGITTVLLSYFNRLYGYTEWQQMSNPDVFKVTLTPKQAKIERIWDDSMLSG